MAKYCELQDSNTLWQNDAKLSFALNHPSLGFVPGGVSPECAANGRFSSVLLCRGEATVKSTEFTFGARFFKNAVRQSELKAFGAALLAAGRDFLASSSCIFRAAALTALKRMCCTLLPPEL